MCFCKSKWLFELQHHKVCSWHFTVAADCFRNAITETFVYVLSRKKFQPPIKWNCKYIAHKTCEFYGNEHYKTCVQHHAQKESNTLEYHYVPL